MRRVGVAVIGGFLGFIVGIMLADSPDQLPLPFVTAALGAILSWAVRRYARF